MDGLIPSSPASPNDGYRVLARKYRPQSFDDLVGQEPMVRTLKNAFETGRIAQAWMLTGVRGVGKTTTARILARGLNYDVPGEADRPTVDLARLGVHCEAIMDGRHVDVIEMDAASHTGIDDIREITDAARYRPASARFKVYIIDEVHMLSKSAFNGLLKTLEEPPEHVKFIFATTEIRKVPVTVLSRCQRFDLRRIDATDLVSLLRRISDAEQVGITDEALALIARAGEGSARDSLSLLDQAIAHGGGANADDPGSAETGREMRGLADRARIIDLVTHLMKGDAAAAMAEFRAQYDVGADPVVVLSDLAEFTHLITRLKIVPGAGDEASVTEVERVRGHALAEQLSLRVLSRCWQMLLKGIAEVQAAPKPHLAADMVLVRIAYAADLPDPEDALKLLRGGDGARAETRQPAADGSAPQDGAPAGNSSAQEPAPPAVLAPRSAPEPAVARVHPPRLQTVAGGGTVQPLAPAHHPKPSAQADEPQPRIALASLAECAALAGEKRDLQLRFLIEHQMKLVRFEPGRIEFQPEENADPDLAGKLGRKLTEWTGMRWIVTVSRTQGRPTIAEERAETQRQMFSDARSDPAVAALIETFPGAKVVDVRIASAADTNAMPLDSDAAPNDIDADA